jgi:hypothetical protein
VSVGPGLDVAITGADADSYTATATSKSTNTFSIEQQDDGTTERTCTGSDGGCNGGEW